MDESPVLSTRFSLVRKLGQGGMGVVYEALDSERGTRVALKTLPKFHPVALYRFKQEFRTLANLSHTSLVPLYELISDGKTWFFTMELVEGVEFLTYVRWAPRPASPDENTRTEIDAKAHDGIARESAPPGLTRRAALIRSGCETRCGSSLKA